jgi:hypothetical protein
MMTQGIQKFVNKVNLVSYLTLISSISNMKKEEIIKTIHFAIYASIG